MSAVSPKATPRPYIQQMSQLSLKLEPPYSMSAIVTTWTHLQLAHLKVWNPSYRQERKTFYISRNALL